MTKQVVVPIGAFVGGLLVALLALSTSGPADYDDCILERLDTDANQMVAGLILTSCRAKFPRQSEAENPASAVVVPSVDRFAERELSGIEVSALTGRAGPTIGNLFGGPIYNGLDTVRVLEVTVEIGYITGADTVRRAYRDEVFIDPLSTGTLQVEVVRADGEYYWGIVAARGRTVVR